MTVPDPVPMLITLKAYVFKVNVAVTDLNSFKVTSQLQLDDTNRLSIDGIYTLANRQIDMQGVVSPFYLVNSIGSFLTRRGEGLIGFNFTIGGTAARPRATPPACRDSRRTRP